MAEKSECNEIVKYLNKGIIEANIKYVKEYDNFVCLAKLKLEIDMDDAYTFKDLIGYIHANTDFGAILVEDDTVILLFRDYKIHQAKAALQKIQRSVWHRFNIQLDVVGITLIDIKDDYKTLMSRLEEYYVMSKISTNKKIFYGTKYFDFYEGDTNFSLLNVLFKKINTVKIHNLYEGVPVIDKVGIIDFSSGKLVLKVDRSKIPFYMQEDFCFLEHDLVPNIIKTTIERANKTQNTLTLRDMEFLDSSPVERSGIRIEPERSIYMTLTLNGKNICQGEIVNLSENSVVARLSQQHLNSLAMANAGKDFFELKCQIPTEKSFITTIKVKATIFRIDEKKAIITIYPSPVSKAKLRSYIAMERANILMKLKTRLKEVTKFF